jgi:hypothetical protein
MNDIFGVLQHVCSAYSTTYIVIDALDECTDREGARTRFISMLRELQATMSTCLMFTSRLIPEIMEKFQRGLTLEVRASNDDVRKYVAGRLTHPPKCIKHNSALKQDIQYKIAEAVDGMFVHSAGPEFDIY